MYDFDRARIYKDGNYRPLVKERRIALPAGVQMRKEGFPLSPLAVNITIMIVGLILFAIEWYRRQAFIVWEALLMVVSGIIGIVLFLMLFSQHPTVSLNLQILFYNPIHWLFIWPVIKGRKTIYWRLVIVMCLIFLAGSLIQSYAEGIWNLALCLLLQSILHTYRIKKQ